MRRRVLTLLVLAALAGCARVRETADESGLAWKAPPVGAPGGETRFGDQSDPRLERLDTQAGVADDPVTEAAVLSRHAAAQRADGDLAGALASYRRALQLRERAVQPDDPALAARLDAIAGTLTSIAALQVQLGQPADAEAALRRALALRTDALGEADVGTARSANNLALWLAAEERYDEAEPFYRQAIRALEQPPGAHDADLATVLENYAALLADAGRPAEAEAVTQRASTLRTTDPAAPAP